MSEQDQVYDFIVVGSGGGSMCAALYLKSIGLNPLILEKTEVIGGSTAMSGGVLWIPNHPLNREAGIADTPEKSQQYLDVLTSTPDPGRGGTQARRQAFVEEGPKMIDFLRSQGIELIRAEGYSDYYDDSPGGLAEGRAIVARVFDMNRLGPEWSKKLRTSGLTLPLTIREVCKIVLIKRTWEAKKIAMRMAFRQMQNKLLGKRLIGTGAALQGRMLEASIKAGVEIRTDSPVRELIMEQGAVRGVVVEKDGKEERIASRLGVLINAGGFSHNPEMRAKYQPDVSHVWSSANPGDTGEMLQEVERIGGSLSLMDESWWISTSMPPGHKGIWPLHITEIAKPHTILVDAAGQRFCDESASYMEVGQRQIARNRTGVSSIPGWMVFDSQYKAKYMATGTMPGKPFKQQWLDEGYVQVGATLEELAGKCGIDAAGLAATVERFNGFARSGKDEDFNRGGRVYSDWFGDPTNKPKASMGTLERGPYYAIQIYPGDVGTAGGVVADEHGRALTADDKVIPGLYATGNSAAPVTGRYYVGPGTSIGASFAFGYIAAKHAASASNAAAVEMAKSA